jgi:hypothetical protein
MLKRWNEEGGVADHHNGTVKIEGRGLEINK